MMHAETERDVSSQDSHSQTSEVDDCSAEIRPLQDDIDNRNNRTDASTYISELTCKGFPCRNRPWQAFFLEMFDTGNTRFDAIIS